MPTTTRRKKKAFRPPDCPSPYRLSHMLYRLALPALEEAGADRIFALMVTRFERYPDIQARFKAASLNLIKNTTVSERFDFLLLLASLDSATKKRARAVERSKAVLHGPYDTDEVINDYRRVERAVRLLRTVIWTGLVRRGFRVEQCSCADEPSPHAPKCCA